jgi:5-methylcytosine-specific restriction enzyme subunit McrC
MSSGRMTDYLEVIESAESLVHLTKDQAHQLKNLSKLLASRRSWWGAESVESNKQADVIRIVQSANDEYRITVRNVVGAISLGDLTLLVAPKIPMDHFVYIASHSLNLDSREVNQATTLSSGLFFHELVARWLVTRAAQILRSGLSTDYEGMKDSLRYVRGRVDATRTSSNFLRGRPVIESEFEERTNNSPENRILKSALNLVNISGLDAGELRSSASRLRRALSDVGDAEHNDLGLPSRTFPPRYRQAVDLAISVIRNSGRNLSAGNRTAGSFLIRTPNLIEDGIRKIIKEAVAPVPVSQGGKVLLPTSLTSNPDMLLSRPPKTADVKYKFFGSMWNRADLAQGVFFAESYRSTKGAVIGFSNGPHRLPEVPVGRITISPLFWDVAEGTNPQESANRLIRSIENWLPSEKQDLVLA